MRRKLLLSIIALGVGLFLGQFFAQAQVEEPLGALRTITIPQGGTGTSTRPSSGEILVGNTENGYDLLATSSLGITGNPFDEPLEVVGTDATTTIYGTYAATSSFGGGIDLPLTGVDTGTSIFSCSKTTKRCGVFTQPSNFSSSSAVFVIGQSEATTSTEPKLAFFGSGTAFSVYRDTTHDVELLFGADNTGGILSSMTDDPLQFRWGNGTGSGNQNYLTGKTGGELAMTSISDRFSIYNTADETTNYERGTLYWDPADDSFRFAVQSAGSGNNRTIYMQSVTNGGSNASLRIGRHLSPFFYFFSDASSVAELMRLEFEGTASSGLQKNLRYDFTANQTGTAGYTVMDFDVTETSTGSGDRKYIDFALGGVTQFDVDVGGAMNFASTMDGIRIYRTADQDTNYSRLRMSTDGNSYEIVSEAGGTGVEYPIKLGGDNNAFFWTDPANNEISWGTTVPNSPREIALNDSTTNAITDMVAFSKRSSGIPAEGFGARVNIELEDDSGGAGDTKKFSAGFASTWEDPTSGSEYGDLRFYTTENGTPQNERLRIMSTGEIGIATTSPRSLLHVSDGTTGTSTVWVGDLTGSIGQVCFGDSDGSGATCIAGNNGTTYSFATSTY